MWKGMAEQDWRSETHNPRREATRPLFSARDRDVQSKPRVVCWCKKCEQSRYPDGLVEEARVEDAFVRHGLGEQPAFADHLIQRIPGLARHWGAAFPHAVLEGTVEDRRQILRRGAGEFELRDALKLRQVVEGDRKSLFDAGDQPLDQLWIFIDQLGGHVQRRPRKRPEFLRQREKRGIDHALPKSLADDRLVQCCDVRLAGFDGHEPSWSGCYFQKDEISGVIKSLSGDQITDDGIRGRAINTGHQPLALQKFAQRGTGRHIERFRRDIVLVGAVGDPDDGAYVLAALRLDIGDVLRPAAETLGVARQHGIDPTGVHGNNLHVDADIPKKALSSRDVEWDAVGRVNRLSNHEFPQRLGAARRGLENRCGSEQAEQKRRRYPCHGNLSHCVVPKKYRRPCPSGTAPSWSDDLPVVATGLLEHLD